MNAYNFTERTRRTLALAREEAARLHHEYVGTEHILLGLIREGEGVATSVLQNLSVDLDKVQRTVEETVAKGKTTQAIGPDLPYTSRAKKVLEFAMFEARALNHSYVGTEHLLLGLLREEKGLAAQVLVASGITLESARQETLRLLGTEWPKDRPAMSAMAARLDVDAVIGNPSETLAAMKETIACVRLLNGRAHRAMAIAREEATRHRDREIGPTHILLGLLQGDGLAARLLAESGLTVDAVRAELERNAP